MCFCGNGNVEDGWGCYSCEHIKNIPVAERASFSLHFMEYEGSLYRQCCLATYDTTYAIELTEEIGRLGFKVEERHPSGRGGSGELYGNSEYAGLKIERQETPSRSIVRRSVMDPIDLPRAQPLDEDVRKQLAKEIGVEELRDLVIIHGVIWVFRVTVQK